MQSTGKICIVLMGFLLVQTLASLVPIRTRGNNLDENRLIEVPRCSDDPLLITGDAELLANKMGGNGVPGDPYIIEDLVIDAGGSGVGIMINGTSAHVVIRNCSVTGAGNLVEEGGILVKNAENVNITNCTFHDNTGYGVYFTNAFNSSMSNSTLTGNTRGAYLMAQNCTFRNNTIAQNSEEGIYAKNSHNSIFINNTIQLNAKTGIALENSVNVSIVFNLILNNTIEGIIFYDSENCTISNNTMINDGLTLLGNDLQKQSHNITQSNTVNGGKLLYFVNKSGLNSEIFEGAGQIILIECNHSRIFGEQFTNLNSGIHIEDSLNITVDFCQITDCRDKGIQVLDTVNCTVLNSTILRSLYGLFFDRTNNTRLINNTITGGNYAGIKLDDSRNSTLKDNFINDTTLYAIHVQYSFNATFINNTLRENYLGIYTSSTPNSTFSSNHLIENGGYGLLGTNIQNSTLWENQFMNDGFMIGMSQVSDYKTVSLDTSNTVNGKPAYYITDQIELSGTDFPNPGLIQLVNCNDSLISDLSIEKTAVAFSLHYCKNLTFSDINGSHNKAGFGFIASNNCTVKNSTFSANDQGVSVSASKCVIQNNTLEDNNIDGIVLFQAMENNISGNRIKNNGWYGISVNHSSNNNMFTGNNVSGNGWGQVISSSSTNYWNNATHGNYWGDYKTRYPDADINGPYWSTPYTISGSATDRDNLPLIGEFTNTAPVITHPSDQTIVEGSVAQILWTVTDPDTVVNPSYKIYQNDVEIKGDFWNSGVSIVISISDLTQGTYEIEFLAEDGLGGQVSDEVLIHVTAPPNTNPTITTPEDIKVVAGTSGVTINWTVTDPNIGVTAYKIYRNGTEIASATWISGKEIAISLEGLTVGDYNYTIVAEDGLGGVVKDEVLVTVTKAGGKSDISGYPIIIPIALIGFFAVYRNKKRR